MKIARIETFLFDPGTAKNLLFLALAAFSIFYVVTWWIEGQRAKSDRTLPPEVTDARMPTPLQLIVGFLTNFFDTLGIGSFAPTTSIFKFTKMVPDRLIPGTLNGQVVGTEELIKALDDASTKGHR